MKFEDIEFLDKTTFFFKDKGPSMTHNIFEFIHLLDQDGLDKLEDHIIKYKY